MLFETKNDRLPKVVQLLANVEYLNPTEGEFPGLVITARWNDSKGKQRETRFFIGEDTFEGNSFKDVDVSLYDDS